MTLLRTLALASVSIVAGIACSGPPAPTPTDAAAATDAMTPADAPAGSALTVVPTGATASAAITADAGGTITLTGAAHTYTLEVTPGALASDVEITLEEVTVPELPSALAVRFSPDGLVFDVPALLRVDAPYDAPMLALAFRAGEPGVEVAQAAPRDGGLAMQIAHFSEAAFAPPAEADAALEEDAVTMAATITDLQRSRALGLGTLLNGRVTLLVENASVRVAELEAASIELQSARANVMLLGIEGFDASRFGPPTLGELVASLLATFTTNADRLHANLTQPTCAAGSDVVALDDWARAVHRLRAALSILMIEPEDRALCVSTRLRVTSTPDVLTPTTDEVVLSTVALELVGPATDPRVQLIGESSFTFVPMGADGPRSLDSATGEVTDVHFARPSGTGRPTTVEITVDGRTNDIQLGGLPAPMPVTVRVGEASLYSGTVSASSSCGTTTSTTITCTGGPIIVSVRDLMRESVDATLRVTVAGDLIGVTATSVTTSRFSDHEVDEHPMPSIIDSLDSVASATGSRDGDGRIRVRICGPSTRVTTVEPECGGSSDMTTSATDACWELLLAESPAGMPTELLPSSTGVGCSLDSSGTLTRE
jgi:hypothetical protein